MADVTEANATKNIASAVAGLERASNSAIIKFFQKIEKAQKANANK